MTPDLKGNKQVLNKLIKSSEGVREREKAVNITIMREKRDDIKRKGKY